MITVKDKNGREYSMATVAKHIFRPASTVTGWYHQGLKSYEKLVERNGSKKYQSHTLRGRKFAFCKGCMTIREAVNWSREHYGEDGQIAVSTIYARKAKWGDSSPVVMFPGCSRKEFAFLLEFYGYIDKASDYYKSSDKKDEKPPAPPTGKKSYEKRIVGDWEGKNLRPKHRSARGSSSYLEERDELYRQALRGVRCRSSVF